MSSIPRTSYSTHGDHRPECELDVLASIYRTALERYEENAARTSGGDYAEERSKNARRKAILPNTS